MDKISKLNMFYNLANTLGILDASNTKATSSKPAPPTTTDTTLVSSAASIVKMSNPTPIMDQLADVAATLIVEELTMPLVSAKRVRVEEHQSPRAEGSPKRAWVAEGGTSKETYPFIKISNIFSSWLPRNPEKVGVVISTLDLSFVQNLPAADKMEMGS